MSALCTVLPYLLLILTPLYSDDIQLPTLGTHVLTEMTSKNQSEIDLTKWNDMTPASEQLKSKELKIDIEQSTV